MKIKEKWTKHLIENKVSYISHLKFAWSISIESLLVSLSIFIHGLLPCFFQTTASDKIKILHTRLKNRDNT